MFSPILFVAAYAFYFWENNHKHEFITSNSISLVSSLDAKCIKIPPCLERFKGALCPKGAQNPKRHRQPLCSQPRSLRPGVNQEVVQQRMVKDNSTMKT